MEPQKLLIKARDSIENGESDLPIDLILSLAKEGNNTAQFLLGYMYFNGYEVPYKEAIYWLEKSASHQNREAQYFLSINVLDKDCLPSDKRLSYLKKSALAGFGLAQYDLACVFANGNSFIEKNLKESRKWYRLAADQGHCEALYNLGMMMVIGEGGDKELAEGLKLLEQCVVQCNDEYAEKFIKEYFEGKNGNGERRGSDIDP
jgi:TPR repeat protein